MRSGKERKEQISARGEGHSRPESGLHYPALDGLRALAFLAVFFDHYAAVPWSPGGVNVFFVLSGFLITGILLDSQDRPDRVRTFYVRRTLRIFPLYYGVLAAVLLSTVVFQWKWNSIWLAWPLYVGNFLLFWQGPSTEFPRQAAAHAWLQSARFPALFFSLGHFWSLCVEEQFYLFWPFVVWAVRSRRKLVVLCATVVLLDPLLRYLVLHWSPAWVDNNRAVVAAGVPFQLDSLLLGAFTVLMWRGAYREELERVAGGLCAVLAVAGVTGLLIGSGGHLSHFATHYVYPRWYAVVGLSLINLFGASLLVVALRPGSWVYAALNLRPLRWLGKISYGAYVFHDIPHAMYHEAIVRLSRSVPVIAKHPQDATMVLAFGSTLLLAQASFRFFELRFLNLKERWAPSMKPGMDRPRRSPTAIEVTADLR